MTSCELCGRDVDSLKKVKIEGATLKACDSCAEMGEEVKTGSKKSRKKKKKRKKRSSKDVLVNDYGDRIKSARESEQLSIAEVADDLNEKESLLAKIEKQDLKPDKPLADKLSKKFGVTLYTNPEVADYDTDNKVDNRKATMEDVADIN
ncbi:MAG: putative transcription factor [Candidatus Nanohaloarchaea archaeon]|jgi:putative transcription factor